MDQTPNPNLQLGTGFKLVKPAQTEQQLDEIECNECFEIFQRDVNALLAEDCPSCGQRWMNT